MKHVFGNKIVCAENDPQEPLQERRTAKRLALSAVMGDSFFPPRIVSHETKKNTLRMSCGGTEELTVDVYAVNEETCGESDGLHHFTKTQQSRLLSKDVRGNDVRGTVGCANMDGGECGGKLWAGFGKESPKSRLQPCRPTPAKRFRIRLGGGSHTCCPSTALHYITSHANPFASSGNPSKYWNEDELRAYKGQPCRIEQFGDTGKCETDFELKIEVRRGCPKGKGKTKRKKMHDLVRIKTTHALLSTAPGCTPWFALADASIRTLVSDLRMQVLKQKVDSCS
jgi:hypothetical protein